MQSPWKPGLFTLSNLSPAYSFLHQKKKPKTKQTLSQAGPCYLFFLDNFSFCGCQLKGKCMCRIHIDQKSGGCLYIIQEIKGWRNFILIWGQQNKVTEKQHVCSSAIQTKANTSFHLGAQSWQDWEAATLLWSLKLNAGLAGTHLRRAGTCTAPYFQQEIQSPTCNVPYFLCHIHTRQEGTAQHLCRRSKQVGTSKAAAERCTETAREQPASSTAGAAWPGSEVPCAWHSKGPVCLSLVLSWDRISPTGPGAGVLTMRPQTRASRCCVGLPWPQHFGSELQKINQLKHAETGSCLRVSHVLSCRTCAKYSRARDCTDDIAPSMYDIHAAFQRGKKPAQPNGWMEKQIASSWFKEDILSCMGRKERE